MFGNRLKNLRKKYQLTQKELAEKLGVSPAAIGLYEQNRRTPDIELIRKIANIFKVSTDYLINDNYSKNSCTGEELLKHIPEEYRESFKKLDIEQLKFVKKMADEGIDPKVLIDTMDKINEYYEKLNKKN